MSTNPLSSSSSSSAVVSSTTSSSSSQSSSTTLDVVAETVDIVAESALAQSPNSTEVSETPISEPESLIPEYQYNSDADHPIPINFPNHPTTHNPPNSPVLGPLPMPNFQIHNLMLPPLPLGLDLDDLNDMLAALQSARNTLYFHL